MPASLCPAQITFMGTLGCGLTRQSFMVKKSPLKSGNDSNLLIVFYVQIMPDDFVMQLHRF
ncbi:periplasmic endochitinase [Shigella sonnei]|nr:periplasmic endochitinase [Shigella sonnei]